MHPGESTGTLTLPRSKTDPEGDGAELFLTARSMDLFRKYTRAYGIEGGRLFRRLNLGIA